MDVKEAIWSLSASANDWKISDELVGKILALLADEEGCRSPFSGDLLMFFEVESAHLTDHQKWLCVRFLNAHGDKFRDGYSSLVVNELRTGLYLKMKKPNPQQWKDYQAMRGESNER